MQSTALPVRPVDATISRLWLLVNGARPETFADAVASAADQVILDVEDAVDPGSMRGAFRLAFGSGDYRRDTGASADDLAMAYLRSRLVVACRIGNLPGPIDGPTVSSCHPSCAIKPPSPSRWG